MHSTNHRGWVPERPITANRVLKFCSVFAYCLPMYCLQIHFVLSLLYLVVKAQQHFVSSSCTFSDEKTLLKIWLNPGLNLTSFEEPGPGESLSSGYVYQGNQTGYTVDNDLLSSGGSRPSEKGEGPVIQTLRYGGGRSPKKFFSALRASIFV